MSRRRTGLALAGAVAMGAFEAGAVSAIAERGIALRRITGTSSGALCAVVLAAGVATGRVALAARVIEESWRDRASWRDGVQFSARSIFARQGVATVEKMRASLLEAIERVIHPAESLDACDPYPAVEFRVIGTDLGAEAGSHERAFTFRGSDFASAEGCEHIALRAAASAAFPGLFAPVKVAGSFVADGGLVDNAPISYLLEAEEIERVILVSASASRPATTKGAPHGVALATSLLGLMIDERMARDAEAAERANARIKRLDVVLLKYGCNESQRRAFVQALGLRPVQIVRIRPAEPLQGTPFSGLGSSALRAVYIALGKKRACAALDAAGALPEERRTMLERATVEQLSSQE